MAGWKILVLPSSDTDANRVSVRRRANPSRRARKETDLVVERASSPLAVLTTTKYVAAIFRSIRPQKHALPASSIARPFSYLRSLRFLSCSELLRLSEVQSPEPEIICNAQSKRKKRKWQQCPGCNRNRKCPCWWPPWPDRRSNFCGQPNNFPCPVPEPNF